jgi:transcriptional regulator with XRE-family HTH domain
MAMTKDLELDRAPNPVDRHVGLRIRLRRKELGVSQERLAESIGLTFQQVQKYERAANRVSASKLWEMARALKTSVAYFYEGLGDPASAEGEGEDGRDSVHDFLLTPEGMELATLFPRVRQPRVRRRLLDLVRTMAEESELELHEQVELEEV